MTISTGVGRGYRNPANWEAGVVGRRDGIHTRIVGSLRSWEGWRFDVMREGESFLEDGELELLCDLSAEAEGLREVLGIRVLVVKNRKVMAAGSRRDVRRRFYEQQRASKKETS